MSKETQTLKIDGFLTEAKLGVFLEELFGTENVKRQYTLKPYRYRIDFAVIRPGKKTILIEYDGDRHFTDYDVIKRDEAVNKVYIEELMDTHEFIRIPYFIQLTTATFKWFFKNCYEGSLQIIQDYPHGFIDSKILPNHFHLLGDKYYVTYIYWNLGTVIESDGRTVREHVDSTTEGESMMDIIYEEKDFIKWEIVYYEDRHSIFPSSFNEITKEVVLK